jgi:hypothetical protein
MQWFKENYLENLDKNQVTVVDLGSQCVPGQKDTYKIFFSENKFRYIGIDISRQPFPINDVGIFIAIKDKLLANNIETSLVPRGFLAIC